MSPLLFLLLLFLQARSPFTLSKEEEEFFKACPPLLCGQVEIRYPLRLNSTPEHCGLKDLVLFCTTTNHTLLALPSLGSYNVTAIDYAQRAITITSPAWAACPLRSFLPLNFAGPIYRPFSSKELTLTLMNCTTELIMPGDDVAGPFACMSGGGYRVYAAASDAAMDTLPSDCVANGTVEIPGNPNSYMVRSMVNEFVRRPEISLEWENSEITENCSQCDGQGGRCAFSWARNETRCAFDPSHRGSHIPLIVGICVSLLLVLILVALYILHKSRRSDKEKETRLKVEQFLANYTAMKPTRYGYAEIKKITTRFTQKLGQGGFGSVYKGELQNGIPVAVKMLENSKGDGEEFINEVATIGRIHHVNVVRLLGFCSEGARRALVYEFMSNGSLEKFIFSEEAKETSRPFSMEKLHEIAIGIAQGIEYLHQGCSQRILHFDIKPHNILLDYDFNPKISDFGLAKLCSRDRSIVTMTAARGTMGYIAPEMYSRNFGAVSYKSDVYSFGMLVLEMVGGRKNIDPTIGDQSDAYFPELIYDRLVQGNDLGLPLNMDCDEEIVRRLTIIALWCIQWNPGDRPSMTRVVQMLSGNLQSLQLPPKPFASNQGNMSEP